MCQIDSHVDRTAALTESSKQVCMITAGQVLQSSRNVEMTFTIKNKKPALPCPPNHFCVKRA